MSVAVVTSEVESNTGHVIRFSVSIYCRMSFVMLHCSSIVGGYETHEANSGENKETSMGNFVPGELMMMDFAYFSVTSIRGYVDYFSITCQATGNGFVFAVPNKSSPLVLIAWIVGVQKRKGRPIRHVRFDEGGELARS